MTTWRIISASVIGTSHLRTQAPCQDYSSTRVLRDSNNAPILVIVAADGAGSAKKAATGSRLVCEKMVEIAARYFNDGGTISTLTRELAKTWLVETRNALSVLAQKQQDSLKDYASTLLAAIVGENEAVFIQLGDGAIVVADDENEWVWVTWPQRGEFANTTFFLTDESAVQTAECSIIKRRVGEVAIFTDGIESLLLHYASKTVHAPFFDRMFSTVRASETDGFDAALSLSLESYLASPGICERTDDDKTLVMATRIAPVVLAGEKINIDS